MDTFFTSAELPEGLRSAFAESRISLSLADAKAEDMPLIAVNQPFCDMSGYGPDEVLDRNCRFLQPDESPTLFARICANSSTLPTSPMAGS